jgi:hypothetical protein
MNTPLIILAILSLSWHLVLARWIAKARAKALDGLPTLAQQIAYLERIDAYVKSLEAGLEKLGEINHKRAVEDTMLGYLRNPGNN